MVKLLAFASFICVALVVAGLNRGFDISDEGLYVLLADPRQANEAGIFNYDLFFKLLFRFTGYTFSLIELRIIRLLGYMAAAWALTNFWKNTKDQTDWHWEVFLLSFLALVAGYAFLPPTLSYNSLAVVLVCLWLGEVSRKCMTKTRLLSLGFLLAALVYVKISLAFVFLPLTLVLLWRKRPLLDWLWIVLPILVSELVFLGVLGENAWTRLSQGIPITTLRPGYQVGLMLKSIAVGVLWTGMAAGMFFLLGRFQKGQSRYFFPFLIMCLAVTISIVFFTHITDEWNHLVMVLGAAALGFGFGLNWADRPASVWVLILLMLPYLMHFGSNVYWLRIAVHYGVFWVFAYLLWFESLKPQAVLVVAAVSVLLVFNGIWWHPFGQERPLWEEKGAWTRPGGEEQVHLDSILVGMLQKLRGAGVGGESEPIMAAYRIPGLVWLYGTQIPFSPGIWDQSQLSAFLGLKPQKLVFNKQDSLPPNWHYSHSQNLGVYQGDSLQLLWD